MKRAFWKLAGVLVVLGMLLPTQAADAGNTVAGGNLTFSGTAHLPKFPCYSPAPFSYPCSGVFSGTIEGELHGVYTDATGRNVPWAFALSSVAQNLSVNFSYFDGFDPGAPCAAGAAQAISASVSAGPGQVVGEYWNNVTPGGQAIGLPFQINDVTIGFSFDWTRVGSSAVLEFTLLSVTLDVTTIGSVTVVNNTTAVGGVPRGINPVGTGAAGFVPATASTTGANEFVADLPACNGDLAAAGPLEATVAGNVGFDVAQNS